MVSERPALELFSGVDGGSDAYAPGVRGVSEVFDLSLAKQTWQTLSYRSSALSAKKFPDQQNNIVHVFSRAATLCRSL